MRDTLGELANLHLGEDVYGVPIVDEIARRTGREVAPAAVYVTLRRLEALGCAITDVDGKTKDAETKKATDLGSHPAGSGV